MPFEDEDNYPLSDKLKFKIGEGEDDQEEKETEAAGTREGSAEKKDQPETITPDQAQSRVHTVVVKAADTARRFFDTFKKGAERIGKAKDQMLGAMLAPIKTEDGVAIDTGLSLAAKQAVEGVRDFGRNLQDMNQNAARAFLDSRPLQSVADSFKALVSIPGEVFRRQQAWKEFEVAAKETEEFQQESERVAQIVEDNTTAFTARLRKGETAMAAKRDDVRLTRLNQLKDRLARSHHNDLASSLPKVLADRNSVKDDLAAHEAKGRDLLRRMIADKDMTEETRFFLQGEAQAWESERMHLDEAYRLVTAELERVIEPDATLQLYTRSIREVWDVQKAEISKDPKAVIPQNKKNGSSDPQVNLAA